MTKKVLVTGHEGFIGAHLCRLLREAGYEPVGLDTRFFGDDCRFFTEEQPGIPLIGCDLRNLEPEALQGLYGICHLAALSNDTLGQIDPELTYDINYRASVRLAHMAREAGVSRFLYSSSCSLYGKAGDDALTEEAEFSPQTAYARSKVLTEQEIHPLASSGFCVTSLRNATAYGVSPKLRVDLVVNNLVGWALTTGTIRIMSDGTPWRPLVHAEDIARAFVALLDADASVINGEAFNIGQNSENYRVREIATLVGEAVPGCRVEITGEHGDDSRSYRVNFDKVARLVPGFQPRWTLREGIADLVEAYRRWGMDQEHFEGRYFIRLKQIRHLLEQTRLNDQLYWRDR